MLRSQSRQVGMGVGYWSVVTQTTFLASKKDWLVPTRLVPCHLNRPPCILSLLEPNIGAFTPIFSKKNVKAFFPQLDSKGQHWEKGEIQQLTKNGTIKKFPQPPVICSVLSDAALTKISPSIKTNSALQSNNYSPIFLNFEIFFRKHVL